MEKCKHFYNNANVLLTLYKPIIIQVEEELEKTVLANCPIPVLSAGLWLFQDVGLALRTLLATVDETLPQLPASTHREVCLISYALPVLDAIRKLDAVKFELL